MSFPTRWEARTDKGRVRQTNEDAYGRVDGPGGVVLYAIADGMGGYHAGDVASRTAVDAAFEAWCSQPPDQPVFQRLSQCMMIGNDAVLSAATARSVLGRMGTTLTLLCVNGHQAHMSHAGDSRAYRLRDGQLAHLTVDHTEAQDRIRAGELDPSSPEVAELDHVVTCALGLEDIISPDFYGPFELHDNDLFLMCTDGLTGLVGDSTILGALLYYPLQKSAQKLVRLANFRGGFDNITVQLIRVGDDVAPLATKPPDFRLDFDGVDRAINVFIALVLAAVIFLGIWLFR